MKIMDKFEVDYLTVLNKVHTIVMGRALATYSEKNVRWWERKYSGYRKASDADIEIINNTLEKIGDALDGVTISFDHENPEGSTAAGKTACEQLKSLTITLRSRYIYEAIGKNVKWFADRCAGTRKLKQEDLDKINKIIIQTAFFFQTIKAIQVKNHKE